MRTRIESWITKKSLNLNPLRVTKGLALTFYLGVTATVISVLLLPTWVTLIFLGLIFLSGVAAFSGLLVLTKAVTDPSTMMKHVDVNDLLDGVDMDEVMKMATSLFGNLSVKPTGPIGVVDEPDRK